MDVAIIGTGFIGTTLGNALAAAGFDVVFGSRKGGVGGLGLRTTTVGGALTAAEAVILAIPGSAVASFAAEHAGALDGMLVIDATNTMGGDVPNARGKLPKTVRYARAFSTLGGENFANPVFPDGRADLFFSAPESDRATVESLIGGVGLSADLRWRGHGRSRRFSLQALDPTCHQARPRSASRLASSGGLTTHLGRAPAAPEPVSRIARYGGQQQAEERHQRRTWTILGPLPTRADGRFLGRHR